MDHSDLDRAYSCAKAADAATLGGDFTRASRSHTEAADLFANAAAAAPENPGSKVLEALIQQHRHRAAYLLSGKAKQSILPQEQQANSPVASPGASLRISRTIDPVDDLVSRVTERVFKSLNSVLDSSRDSGESFYLVDTPESTDSLKRSARAIIKQEMAALAKELRDRDRRVQEQFEEMRRRGTPGVRY